jgi:rRNA maturation endonuclease Nob1
VTSLNPDTFILDTTAFIGLDFPVLQTWQNAIFFTTYTVASELKDIRSKMNLDILKQSGKLNIYSPDQKLFDETSKKIDMVDPQSSLSAVDIEILVLSLQLKGTLITNDLALQNMASNLNVPTRVVSGKKIDRVRKWALRCKNCGKLSDMKGINCPECGGRLKRISIQSLASKTKD